MTTTRPLADRVRPLLADDIIGQSRIWSPTSALRVLAENDRFFGLIFWGPPGTGKTSTARIIAEISQRPVRFLSAVQHGVKDLREVIGESRDRIVEGKKATLVFLDEIHRLTKNQQDVLLPPLESGDIKLIGATTENPSFEVNNAVLSRAMVFRFESLNDKGLTDILKRAIAHPESQFSGLEVDENVLIAVAKSASGDARRALNLLDALLSYAQQTHPDEKGITFDQLKDVAVDFGLRYDRAGDAHYDTISAFIKSVRSSQPDAALHYLARMVEAGEKPEFIARRLLILASEDVGNATPTALLVAQAGFEAVHVLGMPEARITLAQVTTYLASVPKSNRAYMALESALEDVREHGDLEIPLHLRNAPTQLMKEFGYGKGYIYAHNDQKGARTQSGLPEKLQGKKYYEPKDFGAELQLKNFLASLEKN